MATVLSGNLIQALNADDALPTDDGRSWLDSISSSPIPHTTRLFTTSNDVCQKPEALLPFVPQRKSRACLPSCPTSRFTWTRSRWSASPFVREERCSHESSSTGSCYLQENSTTWRKGCAGSRQSPILNMKKRSTPFVPDYPRVKRHDLVSRLAHFHFLGRRPSGWLRDFCSGLSP